ncbi:MAG: thioredoxin [Phycisphaerae bacterium]
MAGANTLEFTDDNFVDEVLKSEIPVLVDFWAEWCGPCKALAPVIDELADEYAGKVKVGKLDTDSNRETATKYSVSAIPSLILFTAGEVKEKFVGLRPKQELTAALNGVAASA